MTLNPERAEKLDNSVMKQYLDTMFYDSTTYLQDHPNLSIIPNSVNKKKRTVKARVNLPKEPPKKEIKPKKALLASRKKEIKNFMTVDGDDVVEIIKQAENVKQSEELVVPDRYDKKLRIQGSALQKRKHDKAASERISSAISRRTGREEEELVMNRGDKFWLKNQLVKFQDQQRPLGERYGLNGWYVSLRRPAKFEGKREAFVNLGSNNKPVWHKIEERVLTKKERMERPASVSRRDFEFISKNKVLRETARQLKIKVREEVDLGIKVTGNNLVTEEKKRLKSGVKYKYFPKAFDSTNSMMNMTFQKQYDDNVKIK